MIYILDDNWIISWVTFWMKGCYVWHYVAWLFDAIPAIWRLSMSNRVWTRQCIGKSISINLDIWYTMTCVICTSVLQSDVIDNKHGFLEASSNPDLDRSFGIRHGLERSSRTEIIESQYCLIRCAEGMSSFPGWTDRCSCSLSLYCLVKTRLSTDYLHIAGILPSATSNNRPVNSVPDIIYQFLHDISGIASEFNVWTSWLVLGGGHVNPGPTQSL